MRSAGSDRHGQLRGAHHRGPRAGSSSPRPGRAAPRAPASSAHWPTAAPPARRPSPPKRGDRQRADPAGRLQVHGREPRAGSTWPCCRSRSSPVAVRWSIATKRRAQRWPSPVSTPLAVQQLVKMVGAPRDLDFEPWLEGHAGRLRVASSSAARSRMRSSSVIACQRVARRWPVLRTRPAVSNSRSRLSTWSRFAPVFSASADVLSPPFSVNRDSTRSSGMGCNAPLSGPRDVVRARLRGRRADSAATSAEISRLVRAEGFV